MSCRFPSIEDSLNSSDALDLSTINPAGIPADTEILRLQGMAPGRYVLSINLGFFALAGVPVAGNAVIGFYSKMSGSNKTPMRAWGQQQIYTLNVKTPGDFVIYNSAAIPKATVWLQWEVVASQDKE